MLRPPERADEGERANGAKAIRFCMFRSVSLCKRTVHYDNILQIVRGTIQSLSGTGCYPKDERPDCGVLPVAGRLRQLLPVSGAGKANEYEADGGRMKALKFHHADTHTSSILVIYMWTKLVYRCAYVRFQKSLRA